MAYVLGIDSGGTKCLIRASRLDGTPLSVYSGASCSHHGRSLEEVCRLLSDHIDACLGQFGGLRQECVGLVCGTTGFDSDEDGEIVSGIYHRLAGLHCPMHIVNDAELAHYTVTGGVGALLIAGTGSIAFGRNEDGETARVGGWLFNMMGDEGSGRYVDAWALHHLSRWMDGRRPRSAMIDRIQEKTGIRTRKQLMDYSIRMATPPWQFPELGSIVAQAAQAGDPYADSILKNAARWNFKLLREVIEALSLDEEESFITGLWGSTITKNAVQRAYLEEMMKCAFPNAVLRISDIDAAEGAVRWALELLRGDEKQI